MCRKSSFRPSWLIIADILPSRVYVRKPVGLAPKGASFRSPPSVESDADTNFHVPTSLSLPQVIVTAPLQSCFAACQDRT
jgi:hypothetical protein